MAHVSNRGPLGQASFYDAEVFSRAQSYGYTGGDYSEAVAYTQQINREIIDFVSQPRYGSPEALLQSLRNYDNLQVCKFIREMLQQEKNTDAHFPLLKGYLFKLCSEGIIKGPKVQIDDTDDEVFGIICEHKDALVLSILLMIAEGNFREAFLFSCCNEGWPSFPLVQALVSQSTSANIYFCQEAEKMFVTALHTLMFVNSIYSVDEDDREVIKLLLEHGADPKMPALDLDHQIVTYPLNLAAMELCDDIVDIMIRMGVNINSRDKKGLTPLCDAFHNKFSYSNLPRKEKIAHTLIDHGADVTVITKDGNTPIHYAAQEGCSREMIKRLIEKGASLLHRNDKGELPLDLAKHDETRKALQE